MSEEMKKIKSQFEMLFERFGVCLFCNTENCESECEEVVLSDKNIYKLLKAHGIRATAIKRIVLRDLLTAVLDDFKSPYGGKWALYRRYSSVCCYKFYKHTHQILSAIPMLAIALDIAIRIDYYKPEKLEKYSRFFEKLEELENQKKKLNELLEKFVG